MTTPPKSTCCEKDPKNYPEPLQRLGERLTGLLDDDNWNNIEPILHEVGNLFCHTQSTESVEDMKKRSQGEQILKEEGISLEEYERRHGSKKIKLTQSTELEKMCLKIAHAVAPYAHDAPRKFHNDEKYLNVPFTDIETVAEELLNERAAYAQTKVNEALKEEMERQKKTVWFTDDVIWNFVMGSPEAGIISIEEFIKRAEKKYINIVSWRVIPHFKPIHTSQS